MLALSEYERRLQSLRDDRSRLVQKLRTAAINIRERGAPPALETIDEFQFYRQRYLELHLLFSDKPEADSDPLSSFEDLEAQAERLRELETLRIALARIGQLQHSDSENALLDQVQDSVQALTAKLNSQPASEEITRFAAGEHSLCCLSNLCENWDTLADEDWDSLQQQVGDQWGRAIAVAAARGRLHWQHQNINEV